MRVILATNIYNTLRRICNEEQDFTCKYLHIIVQIGNQIETSRGS